MGNSFKVATVGGIEIRIDWTWLVAFAFFTWSIGAYYDNTFHSWGSGKAYLIGAASTILLFVTVLLHELGHHHDQMTSPGQRRVTRGESYAEQYARRYEKQVLSAYRQVFKLH